MDRFLLDREQALTQRLTKLETEVRMLRLRANGAGAATEVTHADIAGATDGAEMTLVEFDVDPGRWLVLFGSQAVIRHYTGATDYSGLEYFYVRLSTRPPGASVTDQVLQTSVTSDAAASPVTATATAFGANFPIFDFATVSSETGLTLRMYGNAGHRDGTSKPMYWTSGKMIAIPL